jgi:hypothetical protein
MQKSEVAAGDRATLRVDFRLTIGGTGWRNWLSLG